MSKAAAKPAAERPCPPSPSGAEEGRLEGEPLAGERAAGSSQGCPGNGHFSFHHLRSYVAQTRPRAVAGGEGLRSSPPFDLAIHVALFIFFTQKGIW